MDLNVQFQVILVSYFYGFFFMLCYDLFNRIFYSKKGKLIRLIFELIFFLSFTLLFFIIMLLTCNAYFNIFIILFLLLGVISYILIIQPYFLKYYDVLVNKVYKKLLIIKLKIKVKYDKIKMEKRKKKRQYEKNRRTKES